MKLKSVHSNMIISDVNSDVDYIIFNACSKVDVGKVAP